MAIKNDDDDEEGRHGRWKNQPTRNFIAHHSSLSIKKEQEEEKRTREYNEEG